MFIDSHAHLFFPNFENDLDDVIARAKSVGVKYILVPATDIPTAEKTIELSKKYESVYGAVGVHPHDTKEWDSSFIPKIEELAKHEKIVAIGEIGLDYFYDYSPKQKQIEAFKAQIDLAIKLNLPIIVHNRESDEDIMNIIRSYKGSGLRGQFHCFNGSKEDAKELIELGHFISFTGNITFKKAETLRDTLKYIPAKYLLTETDSPFMTPVPFRGKRNEPERVKLVAEKMAQVHNLRVEDISRIAAYNLYKLFGIGEKPDVSYSYMMRDSLYLNITNRCNAECIFCDREGEAVINGYNLKMNKGEEPSADVFINEIGDPKKFKEVVFCGYGEPTIRWDVVKEISKYVKDNGGKTRLNTNGHGNFINKKDITREMKGLLDSVSISLNALDEDSYARLVGVEKKLFYEMLDFSKKAKEFVDEVVLTIVAEQNIDAEKARKFVEENVGVKFREREYF
ncbi:MAG TPA: TatD family hydrolase [Ignavibacteriaceae bacterium]|nr:TatD family hydrolase [Ignavibacteriaceae bacterium]